MRRLHTADWRSRTTTARLPGVLARTLPDAKAFAMRVLGHHPINFAEHSRVRPGRWRRSTASWWRSAMTSSSNSTRPRNRPASHERSAELDASMPVTLRPGKINRQTFRGFRSFQ
jgi:hypothetical protein